MCQAYEAERNFLVHMEGLETIKGYRAHRDGQPRSSNPNITGNHYYCAWDHGWDCREEGIVPWAIVSIYREKQGLPCYKTPSIEKADRLV